MRLKQPALLRRAPRARRRMSLLRLPLFEAVRAEAKQPREWELPLSERVSSTPEEHQQIEEIDAQRLEEVGYPKPL